MKASRLCRIRDYVVASLTDPRPPNTNVADTAVTIDQSQHPIVDENNLTLTLGVTNNDPQPATVVRFPYALSPHTHLIFGTQIKAPLIHGRAVLFASSPHVIARWARSPLRQRLPVME